MDIVLTGITGVWVLLILGFAAAMWMLHCNEKTYNQRHKLIELINTQADLDAFRSATYNQHLWALFFFRNPYNLYQSPLVYNKVK